MVSIRGIPLSSGVIWDKTVFLVNLFALGDVDHAVRPHLGVFSKRMISFVEVFDFVNKHLKL